MEDILELYCLPYDPRVPVVNMDEQPVQLIQETRRPIPAHRGRPARYDYEYERAGTANVFVFIEPLRGWRKTSVRERKTRIEWAHEIKELLEVDYPHAEKVRLVSDNLNTHTIASLYEAFPPQEARRLAKRLEMHHTPKHGSWLNVAESELSVLTRQCLDRRIPDVKTLTSETKAWERRRNATGRRVDWRFTTRDARIRLKHLYPHYKE